jgi:hypothetical protein
MAFKFKDLMINVTSGGGGADTPICTVDTVRPAGQAATCTVDTVDPARAAGTCTVDTVTGYAITCTVDTVYRCGLSFGLGGRDTGTGVCTVDTVRPATLALMTTVTTVTTLVAASGGGSVSLGQLKAQLQQALADVEARERAQEGGLPKTVEEADDLERRLEGALEELRDHRKSLQKSAKKEAPKARKPKK